ncbi:MAG: cytidine deaminase [Deltaproteobacteria bacterium]|nr:MAG: cytidine deaminase [Deltaproteobacteria bacterium]
MATKSVGEQRRAREEIEEALVEAAMRARENAYAPYSEFRVGAALRCEDGTIFGGCNVENASYGLCLCGERSALAAAVSAGYTRFTHCAVLTETSPPSPPCGICLQALVEFADDLPILLANTQGERIRVRLKDLLPFRFNRAHLLDKRKR